MLFAEPKRKAINEVMAGSSCLMALIQVRRSILAQGTVKWFSNEKGFGFIEQSEGRDLFVHHSSIDMTGYRTLAEGQKVTFEIEESDRGPVAKNVAPF